MAFDCLFYLKMSFLAKNAKFLKNEKLIKKLRNHSVDTCILKTLHSLEAKPLGCRGQSSRKPLGLSHIKKQNQHSESPVFVSELLLLLLFSSILLTFSAIRNFFLGAPLPCSRGFRSPGIFKFLKQQWDKSWVLPYLVEELVHLL